MMAQDMRSRRRDRLREGAAAGELVPNRQSGGTPAVRAGKNGENGLALLLVISAVALLVIMGAAVMSLVMTDIQITENQAASAKALYLAEAGIEKAISALKRDKEYDMEVSNLTGAYHIYINEVMARTATQNEYIELYNASTVPWDVAGWQFADNPPPTSPTDTIQAYDDGVHTPTTVIPPAGYGVILDPDYDLASDTYGVKEWDSERAITLTVMDNDLGDAGLGNTEEITLLYSDGITVADTYTPAAAAPTADVSIERASVEEGDVAYNWVDGRALYRYFPGGNRTPGRKNNASNIDSLKEKWPRVAGSGQSDGQGWDATELGEGDFSVQMTDETGRVNLNYADTYDNGQVFLQEVVRGHVPLGDEAAVAAAIIAYRHGVDGRPGVVGIDDDGMNGVDDTGELDYDGTDDRPFESTEEVKEVLQPLYPGSYQQIYEDMEDLITAYTSPNTQVQDPGGARSPININTASSDILYDVVRPITGMDDALASTFANEVVDYRDGADNTEGTEDDNPFDTQGEFNAFVDGTPALAGLVDQIKDNSDPTDTRYGAGYDCWTTEFCYGSKTFEAESQGRIRVGAGQGWQQLDENNTEGQYDLQMPAASPLAGTWAFTGSYGGGTKTFSLAEYAGDTVWIKFEFASMIDNNDNDNDYAGWYIDNIQVSEGATVYFSDDLESGVGDWVIGGIERRWQLGIPSGPGPVYGNNAFATHISGYYNCSRRTRDCLITPAIDLSAASSPSLSFWAWYDMESGLADGDKRDGAIVKIWAGGTGYQANRRLEVVIAR